MQKRTWLTNESQCRHCGDRFKISAEAIVDQAASTVGIHSADSIADSIDICLECCGGEIYLGEKPWKRPAAKSYGMEHEEVMTVLAALALWRDAGHLDRLPYLDFVNHSNDLELAALDGLSYRLSGNEGSLPCEELTDSHEMTLQERMTVLAALTSWRDLDDDSREPLLESAHRLASSPDMGDDLTDIEIDNLLHRLGTFAI